MVTKDRDNRRRKVNEDFDTGWRNSPAKYEQVSLKGLRIDGGTTWSESGSYGSNTNALVLFFGNESLIILEGEQLVYGGIVVRGMNIASAKRVLTPILQNDWNELADLLNSDPEEEYDMWESRVADPESYLEYVSGKIREMGYSIIHISTDTDLLETLYYEGDR